MMPEVYVYFKPLLLCSKSPPDKERCLLSATNNYVYTPSQSLSVDTVDISGKAKTRNKGKHTEVGHFDGKHIFGNMTKPYPRQIESLQNIRAYHYPRPCSIKIWLARKI